MRNSLITCLIGLALLIAIVGCGEREKFASPNDAPQDIILPDAVLEGATIYLYDRGKVTAEIQADSIVKFEAMDSTVAFNLDVNSYDSLGKVETHVVGDSGIIREKTGELYIYGNVDVTTAEGSRLQSEYLYWDSDQELIKSDKFVRITKGQDVITGIGLESDEHLHRIRILKQVSGQLHNSDEISE